MLEFFNGSKDYLIGSLVISLVVSLIVLIGLMSKMKIKKQAKINLSYMDPDRTEARKIRDVFLYKD